MILLIFIPLPQNPLELPPFPLAHSARFLRHHLTLQHALHAVHRFRAQGHAAHPVVLEGGVGQGEPVLDAGGDHLGIDADFVLSMGVGAQAQEVEEVVQVHLPVPLGVDVGGQVHPGEFAGEALLGGSVRLGLAQHRLVVVVGAVGVGFEEVEDAGGFLAGEGFAAALVVGGALGGEV